MTMTAREAIEGKFNAGVVCSVTGVNPVTLRAWRHRGHLKVGGSRDGWLKYSYQDLFTVATMQRLIERNLQTEAAALISMRSGVIGAIVASENPRDNWKGWAIFWQDNEYQGFHITDPADLAVLPKLNATVVHVIDMGEIVRSVFQQLEALKAD